MFGLFPNPGLVIFKVVPEAVKADGKISIESIGSTIKRSAGSLDSLGVDLFVPITLMGFVGDADCIDKTLSDKTAIQKVFGECVFFGGRD
jgi:hypothetical protein